MSTFPQATGWFSKTSGHEGAQSKLLLQFGTSPRQRAHEAAQWRVMHSAKSGEVGSCRQTLTVPTLARGDATVWDSCPFSSHCQGTHSPIHNLAMLWSLDSTTPKLLAILLTVIEHRFFKCLGENHSFFFFFRSAYITFKIHQELGKHLGKSGFSLICCAVSGGWYQQLAAGEWTELRTQVSKLLCSSECFYLNWTSCKIRAKPRIFSFRHYLRKTNWFLPFQNAFSSTEEGKAD